jgi:hypothetical protein
MQYFTFPSRSSVANWPSASASDSIVITDSIKYAITFLNQTLKRLLIHYQLLLINRQQEKVVANAIPRLRQATLTNHNTRNVRDESHTLTYQSKSQRWETAQKSSLGRKAKKCFQKITKYVCSYLGKFVQCHSE